VGSCVPAAHLRAVTAYTEVSGRRILDFRIADPGVIA
jgi:hypothetical protein